jgi:hypothetical protein
MPNNRVKEGIACRPLGIIGLILETMCFLPNSKQMEGEMILGGSPHLETG